MANIQKRGKGETIAKLFHLTDHPSICCFYLFVCSSAPAVSPRATSSNLVISPHHGANTRDVWLSCHLLEVTNGGIFLPWSCFANPHPVRMRVTKRVTSCFCESRTVMCSYFVLFLSKIWCKTNHQDFQDILIPGGFFCLFVFLLCLFFIWIECFLDDDRQKDTDAWDLIDGPPHFTL